MCIKPHKDYNQLFIGGKCDSISSQELISVMPSEKKIPVDRPGFSKKGRMRASILHFILFLSVAVKHFNLNWPPFL